MTRLTLAAIVAAALASNACGKNDTPTAPTASFSPVDATSRLFAGTLGTRGTAFFSFTVPQDSGVFVTLASVTLPGVREPSGIGLGVGLGVPRGEGCVIGTRVVTTAGLSPQIREWTTKGVHCVSVYDPDALKAGVEFAVRIGYFQ